LPSGTMADNSRMSHLKSKIDMAEGKNTVVVYRDWIDKFEELTDEEAGKLIKHFFRYVNDLNPIAPDRITKLSFIDIEKSLKRDLIKWDKKVEGRSIAGKASAEARKREKELQQNSTNPTIVDFVQQTSTNPTDSDSVNDSVNVNDSDSDILLEKETKENINKIPISKNEIYSQEILESQSWIETISMQNKITPEEIPKWIDDFNKKLISELDNKISKKEYASHFSRWLPGEIIKSKQNGKQQPQFNNQPKQPYKFDAARIIETNAR
jgi:hypothetical protein